MLEQCHLFVHQQPLLSTLNLWKVLAHPDEEGEGQGEDPPLRGDRVGADKVGVENVEEEGGVGGLEDEPKVEHPELVTPCWKMESAQVLMMITSAHRTCRQ